MTETTRREFLKTSGSATLGVALASSVRSVGYTAEDNTVKIALVGCGGRGTGAVANALQTAGPTKLWAVADVFSHHIENSLTALSNKFKSQIEVPKERRFVGFDAYKKAVDSLDKHDVVIFATPPVFRPLQLEYAVNRGVNVFMEKPFAVDVPGVLKIKAAGEMADQKNLKIAGGLIGRHFRPLEEAVRQIHDQKIGDVLACYAYRMQGSVALKKGEPGISELGYQIVNYSGFIWLSGGFLVEWMIQNMDTCCWVKGGWPVSVQGMGGRHVRTEADQLFDHYMAEYTFVDGTRMIVQGRQMMRCWDYFGDTIQGLSGSALLGEGLHQPTLFKGYIQNQANEIWTYRGPGCDAYQREQDRFFEAIRNNTPYNESGRCADACLTAVMGRMACESGRVVTREQALKSTIQLAPLLEQMNSLHDAPPVLPDADGHYPIAKPGFNSVI